MRRWTFVVVPALVLGCLLAALGASACRDGRGSAGPAPADGPRGGAGLRIVSFSPAISRTLVDLGLEDRVVGRTRFCDFLDPAVPVVGDLLDVEYERLVALEPTHVLVQASGMGVDPQLAALARRRGWTLRAWSAVDRIEDIRQMVGEMPRVLCGEDPGCREPLERRAAQLLDRMTAALRPVRAPPSGGPTRWRGRTLLVYGIQPVGVFGRGTYLDQVLRHLGALNAAACRGWCELTLEDVRRLDPGAIILIRPGAAAGSDPLAAAGVLGRLDVAAVRAGRVAVLGHPDALRPSTGIIGVAGEMRGVLAALGAGGERGP